MLMTDSLNGERGKVDCFVIQSGYKFDEEVPVYESGDC